MGTYKNLEDAIKARQRAEDDFYGAFLEEYKKKEILEG